MISIRQMDSTSLGPSSSQLPHAKEITPQNMTNLIKARTATDTKPGRIEGGPTPATGPASRTERPLRCEGGKGIRWGGVVGASKWGRSMIRRG